MLLKSYVIFNFFMSTKKTIMFCLGNFTKLGVNHNNTRWNRNNINFLNIESIHSTISKLNVFVYKLQNRTCPTGKSQIFIVRSAFTRVFEQYNENILKNIGILKIRYYMAEWKKKKKRKKLSEKKTKPLLSAPRRYNKNNNYNTDKTIMPYKRRV